MTGLAILVAASYLVVGVCVEQERHGKIPPGRVGPVRALGVALLWPVLLLLERFR